MCILFRRFELWKQFTLRAVPFGVCKISRCTANVTYIFAQTWTANTTVGIFENVRWIDTLFLTVVLAKSAVLWTQIEKDFFLNFQIPVPMLWENYHQQMIIEKCNKNTYKKSESTTITKPKPVNSFIKPITRIWKTKNGKQLCIFKKISELTFRWCDSGVHFFGGKRLSTRTL